MLTRLDVRAHPRLPHAHRSLRCSQAERALTAEEIWRKSESFRRQHAISSDAFIFCSFNQFYKITPELWQAWLNILQRVPGRSAARARHVETKRPLIAKIGSLSFREKRKALVAINRFCAL